MQIIKTPLAAANGFVSGGQGITQMLS